MHRYEIMLIIPTFILVVIIVNYTEIDKSKTGLFYYAAAIFIFTNIYNRAKERRNRRVKNTEQIFFEWSSPQIRESRIYMSHWLTIETEKIKKDVHIRKGDPIRKKKIASKLILPSLSKIEKDAKAEYKLNFKTPLEQQLAQNEIESAVLREKHAFQIYQYFERWALLEINNGLDANSMTTLMSSYKEWWMTDFIEPWFKLEVDDMHIKKSLDQILAVLK